MTLDELLLQMRTRQLLLIDADEVWPSARYTRQLARAVHRHRNGLALLMRWSSVEVCPARDLHRRYWKYAGSGNYMCEICQRLNVA